MPKQEMARGRQGHQANRSGIMLSVSAPNIFAPETLSKPGWGPIARVPYSGRTNHRQDIISGESTGVDKEELSGDVTTEVQRGGGRVVTQRVRNAAQLRIRHIVIQFLTRYQ